ncbi:MAG: hypothetical protein ACK53Y_08660, partial [bacterium]
MTGQQSVGAPSSTGEGTKNHDITKNLQTTLPEQSYPQPNLACTTMETSPSATTIPNEESSRVVSSVDNAATFNFFLKQQQQ